MLTPIILFAFNRLVPLQQTIASLLANEEAQESVLYVYVDGARPNHEGEDKKVQAVQDYIRSIKGFKEIHTDFSNENRGLGASIIRGVTEVIHKHGQAIVLEDDLVLSPNFLCFMNQGLERYAKETRVFSICGYSNQVKVPSGYTADTYFCTRSSSWGWATWADRWDSVNWELEHWDTYKPHAAAFNRWGGSDCWKMLRDWHDGRNQSWAIRYCFNQFLQNKLSLFPIISKVDNRGFDGEGTNCKKWSRFKFVFDTVGKRDFTYPSEITTHPQLYKSAMSYHSILMRTWSRLMYMLRK